MQFELKARAMATTLGLGERQDIIRVLNQELTDAFEVGRRSKLMEIQDALGIVSED